METSLLICCANQWTGFFMMARLTINELNMSVKMIIKYSEKHPSKGVLRKSYSENMQQIHRRTPMPKCDFKTVALQLYWKCTLAWVLSCKFTAYFQNTFFYEHLSTAASVFSSKNHPNLVDIGSSKLKSYFLYTEISENMPNPQPPCHLMVHQAM